MLFRVLLLTFIQKSVTLAIRCQDGEFWSQDDQQCHSCQTDCQTCLGAADNCTACKNSFQVPIQGICKLCPLNSFTMDGQSCIDCDPSETCELCFGKNQCLKCKQGFYLSLVDYKCYESECPENTALVDLEGNLFCRDRHSYYLDGSSEAPYELGTIEFPFKKLHWPFREIYNQRMDETEQMSVFIKRRTDITMFSAKIPVYFARTKDLRVVPYPEAEPGENLPLEEKPIIYGKAIEPVYDLNETLYNPWEGSQEMASFQIQRRVDRGDVSPDDGEASIVKFGLFRANVTFENIVLNELIRTNVHSNPWFEFGRGWDSHIHIRYSVIWHYNLVLQSYTCYHAILEDSEIYTRSLNAPVIGWRCQESCEKFVQKEQSIIVRNNYFEKLEYTGEYAPIFALFSVGNFTFENNFFKNHQQNSPRGYLEMVNANNCPYIGHHSLKFNYNTFEGRKDQVMSGIFYQTLTEQPDTPGVWSFIVKGNVYRNVTMSLQLWKVEAQKPYKEIIIADNRFEDIDFPVNGPLFLVNQAESAVTVSNNTAVGSKLDSFLQANAKSVSISETYITDSSTAGMNVNGMLQVQAEVINIKDYQVKGSSMGNPQIYLSGSKQVVVEGMYVSESSFSSSQISFNDIEELSFKNIQISDCQDSGQGLTFFDYGLIQAKASTMVSLTIEDVTMKNSALSFIQFQSLLVEPASLPVEISIKNSQISDIEHSNPVPLIWIKDINSQLLTFKFQNIAFSEITMAQPLVKVLANTKVTFDQINFADNEANIFTLQPFNTLDKGNPLVVEVRDSQFHRNFGLQDAILIGNTNSIAKLWDSEFQDNYNLGRGGVVLADSVGSQFEFYDSFFERNYAVFGGVAYAQSYSSVQFTNCELWENFAVIGGVAFIGTDGLSKVSDSLLVRNSALNSQLFFIINSVLENKWSMLTLTDNSLVFQESHYAPAFQARISQEPDYKKFLADPDSIQSDPIVIYKGSAALSGRFTFNQQRTFMSASASSIIKFTDFRIENSELDSILKASSSQIHGSGIVLKNISQMDSSDYLFKVLVQSTLAFNGAEVENVGENFVKAEQSDVSFANSEIKNIYSSAETSSYFNLVQGSFDFKAVALSDIKISNRKLLEFLETSISLTSITAAEFSQPFLSALRSKISIIGSSFTKFNFAMLDQAGLMIVQSSVDISDSQFENFQGGQAIKCSQVSSLLTKNKIGIKSSEFRNIRADNGGAICLQNYDSDISDSEFIENQAESDGGALYLSCEKSFMPQCDFIVERNKFIRNRAERNGGGISFDLQPFKYAEGKENSFEGNSAGSGYGNDFASYGFKLELEEIPPTVSSGQALVDPFFVLRLVDYHGQRLTTDSESKTIASIPSEDASIQGFFQEKHYRGKVVFADFLVKAEPKSEIKIVFSNDIIDHEAFALVTGQEFTDLEFTFNLIDCLPGEILKDNECLVCPPGTYQLKAKQTSCMFCPDNFSCTGGSHLSVDQGYWRSSTESNEVFPCLEPEACAGGYESECSYGYSGVICSDCIGEEVVDGVKTGEYYARSGKYGCQKCESQLRIGLKLFGVIVLMIVYVAIMVTIIILSANRRQQNSVLMRIMTNYFQIVLMIRNLDIVWPERVETMLKSISFVSSAQEDLLQVSCLFKGKGYSPYFLSLLSLSVLPLILAVCGFAFWWMLSRAMPVRFHQTWKRNSVTTALTIAYLIYPSITNSVFQGMNCTEVEGVKYLKQDILLECYSSEHLTILLGLVAPCFLIWTIGFPVFTFFQLKKKRKLLDRRENVVQYGLFYIGLRDETYYWEVVINNIRKISVSLISVALGSNQGQMQLLLIFTLLYMNHQLIKHLAPYQERLVNQIDLQSSTAALFAVILGLMFLRGNENRSAAEMEIIFWALLFLNVLFVIRWVAALGSIYVHKVQTKIIESANAPRQIKMFQGHAYNRRNFPEEYRKEQEERRLEEKEKNLKVLKYLRQGTVGHVPETLTNKRLTQIMNSMDEEDAKREQQRRQDIIKMKTNFSNFPKTQMSRMIDDQQTIAQPRSPMPESPNKKQTFLLKSPRPQDSQIPQTTLDPSQKLLKVPDSYMEMNSSISRSKDLDQIDEELQESAKSNAPLVPQKNTSLLQFLKQNQTSQRNLMGPQVAQTSQLKIPERKTESYLTRSRQKRVTMQKDEKKRTDNFNEKVQKRQKTKFERQKTFVKPILQKDEGSDEPEAQSPIKQR